MPSADERASLLRQENGYESDEAIFVRKGIPSSREPQIFGLPKDGWSRHSEPAIPCCLSLRLAMCSTGAYVSLLGIRKSWAAMTFSGAPLLFGANPKVSIGISQCLGYMTGKFCGVAIVARITSASASLALGGASLCAVLGWAGFYLLPPGVLTLLSVALGSMPLAMCWSLIYRYIEGRRCSDAVSGFLGTALMLGPGVAKLAGASVLVHRQQRETWDIPLATSAIFLPILGICLAALHTTPQPTAAEKADLGDRTVHRRMDASIGGGSTMGDDDSGTASNQSSAPTREAASAPQSASSLLLHHWPGVLCVGCYNGCLLAAREIRDVFQAEVWISLYGQTPSPSGFLVSEIPATLALIILLQVVSRIRSPERALLWLHGLMLVSALLMPLLCGLRSSHALSGTVWFGSLGCAIAVGTVIVSASFFDRLVSALQLSGSVASLIQAIDALGYCGTVLALAAIGLQTTSDFGHEASHDGGGGRVDSSSSSSSITGHVNTVDGNDSIIHGHSLEPPVSTASALLELQHGHAHQTTLQMATAVAGAFPGSRARMLHLAEAAYFFLGPVAAICALGSLLYWTKELQRVKGVQEEEEQQHGY